MCAIWWSFSKTSRKKKEKEEEKDAPQRSGSFDDDLFLGIREATDQRSDDVFTLQETPRGRVVVNQV
jgi:hypothetical protein